jgi:serine/threonine protein kinase
MQQDLYSIDNNKIIDDDSSTIEEISECSDICDIFRGSIINNTYILLHKLGSGSFAQVWLAYKINFPLEPNNKNNQQNKNEFCALKIQNYDEYENGKKEREIFNKLNQVITIRKKETSKNKDIYCNDYSYINTILDSFVYQPDPSDDRKYMCMKFQLMGGSLYDLINSGKYKYGLPLNIIKSVIRQTLIGLKFIHEKAKIVHTDIKPENILFDGISNISQQIINEFNKINIRKTYFKYLMNYCSKNKIQLKKLKKKNFSDVLILVGEYINEFINEKFPNDDDTDDSDDDDSDDDEDDNDSDDDEDDDDSDDDDDEDDDYDDDDDDDDSEDNIKTDIECNIDNEMKNILKMAKKDKEYAPLNGGRLQSFDDYVYNPYIDYYKKNGKKVDLESCYNFVELLNNAEKSSDKEPIINDKYVTNCKIKISDFGSCCEFTQLNKDEIQTRYYRAPEIILDSKYNNSIDIWSIGCSIFELATGFILFDPLKEPMNKDIQHLFLMEKILGPIPKNIIESSRRGKFFYDIDENGEYKLKSVHKINYISLEELLINQHKFNDKDAKDLSEFIKLFLNYDPSKRIKIDECLEHSFLNE